MIINLSVERSRSLTCLAAAQQFRANRVDTKDESMMIVAHGVARQVSRIAEGHEVLLPHIVLALRLVINNMRDNKVIMIQRLRQRILGVSKQTLHSTEIDQRSERERGNDKDRKGNTYTMLVVNYNRGAACWLVFATWLMLQRLR